jgi:two-component system chemotaxis response regulator CheY
MAKILVVDDAGFIRRWCRTALAEAGYDVVEATNGQEGIRMFRESRPDVVLLDVTMPILDGMTALQKIREADPSARVIMLTSEGQMNTVVQARRLGARDFIVKPCESSRLLASVERVLA